MKFLIIVAPILGAVVANAQSLSMLSLPDDIDGLSFGSLSMDGIEFGTFAEAKATKGPAEAKATKGPAAAKATKGPAAAKATKGPAVAKATKGPAAKAGKAETLSPVSPLFFSQISVFFAE